MPEGWVENPFVRCPPEAEEQVKAVLIGTWKPDHAVKTDPHERDLSEKEMMSIQKFALVSINEKSFGGNIWYTPCLGETSVEGTGQFRVFPNGFAPMGFPNESEIVYWVDTVDPTFIGARRIGNFFGYLAGPNDLLIRRSVFKTIKEQRENNFAEYREGCEYDLLSGYYLYYKRVEAAAHDLPD